MSNTANRLVQVAPRTLPRVRNIQPPRPTPTFDLSAFPDQYALICDGRCLEPTYCHGDELIFSKSERYLPGDVVAIFRRPEYLQPGENQFYVKELLMAPLGYWDEVGPRNTARSTTLKPLVMVRMWNPMRVITFRAEELYGMHKLVGVAPRRMRELA